MISKRNDIPLLRNAQGLLSIAIWIVVLLGLVEKVNINQISDFQ
jgi:hypothetical protein